MTRPPQESFASPSLGHDSLRAAPAASLGITYAERTALDEAFKSLANRGHALPITPEWTNALQHVLSGIEKNVDCGRPNVQRLPTQGAE